MDRCHVPWSAALQQSALSCLLGCQGDSRHGRTNRAPEYFSFKVLFLFSKYSVSFRKSNYTEIETKTKTKAKTKRVKTPTGGRFAPPSQVPPLSFPFSCSFQFPFNLNYETTRLKTGSRTPATTQKRRTKKKRKKQSVSQTIDLVVTMISS